MPRIGSVSPPLVLKWSCSGSGGHAQVQVWGNMMMWVDGIAVSLRRRLLYSTDLIEPFHLFLFQQIESKQAWHSWIPPTQLWWNAANSNRRLGSVLASSVLEKAHPLALSHFLLFLCHTWPHNLEVTGDDISTSYFQWSI